MPRLWVTFALAMCCVSPAWAQSGDAQGRHERADIYEFDDELLSGDGLWGNVPVITVRKEAVRVTLIRPRTSFVSELQKSVEDL